MLWRQKDGGEGESNLVALEAEKAGLKKVDGLSGERERLEESIAGQYKASKDSRLGSRWRFRGREG